MNTTASPLSTSSTSKAEGYFVGASKIRYTKHFAQPQLTDQGSFALSTRVCLEPQSEFLNLRRYAFFVLRYERASSSDFPIVCLWHDLYKQKTIEERIRAFARAALPRLTYEKASDLSGPNVPLVDVAAHRKTSLTLDLNWLFSAMKGGIERSSSEEIMCAIKGLNGLLKNRRFGELNLIIGMVPPQKLSPELMLTFARITFPVRDFLSNWFPFVRKIKHELDRRELDSKKLLKGLI